MISSFLLFLLLKSAFGLDEKCYVLKKSVSYGEVLDMNNLEAVNEPYCRPVAKEFLSGKQFILSLAAGSFLERRHLRELKVVKTGDRIKGMIKNKTFTISFNLRALKPAALGETIPLIDKNSGRIYKGRVISPKAALIWEGI